MDYSLILKSIIDVYISSNVLSFPVDCQDLISDQGYRVYTYRQLAWKSSELREMCNTYSEDSFRDGFSKIVAYNDLLPQRRIRFSLAHELGHIVLQHKKSTPDTEKEANFFASNLLAPRMAIHYARCKNETDVAKVFELSQEAARYAFDDYRRWYRGIIRRQNKMTSLDRAVYYHFFDSEHKCFVFSRKNCVDCGKEIINSISDRCPKCEKRRNFRLLYAYDDRDPQYQCKWSWWM